MSFFLSHAHTHLSIFREKELMLYFASKLLLSLSFAKLGIVWAIAQSFYLLRFRFSIPLQIVCRKFAPLLWTPPPILPTPFLSSVQAPYFSPHFFDNINLMKQHIITKQLIRKSYCFCLECYKRKLHVFLQEALF